VPAEFPIPCSRGERIFFWVISVVGVAETVKEFCGAFLGFLAPLGVELILQKEETPVGQGISRRFHACIIFVRPEALAVATANSTPAQNAWREYRK